MIHFIIHLTTEEETTRLPGIEEALRKCYPASSSGTGCYELHVYDQLKDMENIKSCGFGWTLRFLRAALTFMGPHDLLIKIDPDIVLRGDPMEGIRLTRGCCFGQIKMVQDVPVFLGGFQGFTYEAIEALVERGPEVENEIGPQDIILYRLGDMLGLPFITLPWVDLWAERGNYDPNSKVISWRSR